MDMNNSRPANGTQIQNAPHFYVGLLSAALKDVAITCNQSDTELARDILEIENRSKFEGITFLTRTLPSLGKAID